MTITRRELYRLTVAAAAGAILPKAAFAFGGPSGAHTIYKVQGHIGEVELNPYKIARSPRLFTTGDTCSGESASGLSRNRTVRRSPTGCQTAR